MRKPISEAARKAAAKRANQEPGTWNLVCYAFEAFMWGFVSDVDIETEPWRWMGEFRLTLGSLRRIAALRHYPARLLTLEQEGADAHMTTCQFHDKCAVCKVGQDLHHERHARLERLLETSKDGTVTETIKIIEEPSAEEIVEQKTRRNSIIIPEEELVQEDIRASIELASAPEKKKKSKKKSKETEVTKDVEDEEEVAKDDTVSTTAKAAEEKDDVSSPSTSSKSKKHNKPVSSEDLESTSPSKKPVVEESSPDPDSTTNTPVSYRKSKKKSNKRSKVISVEEAAPEVQENPAVMRGLAKGLDTLIPFDPMVPGFNMAEGWQEREDKFVYFVASNISHLAGDLKAAPFAHTSGGAVDLIFATSIAKMEFLDLLAGSMENGRYVSNSNVTYEKTKAFVLIPTGKPGIMDMDGEEYDSLPTAIEVHPGVIRACVAVWNLSLHPDDV
jgi:diacylglycerol kinase family enzyme